MKHLMKLFDAGRMDRDKLAMVRNHLRIAACKTATVVCAKSGHFISFEQVRLAIFGVIDDLSDDTLRYIWDNPNTFKIPVVYTPEFEVDISDLAQLTIDELLSLYGVGVGALKAEVGPLGGQNGQPS